MIYTLKSPVALGESVTVTELNFREKAVASDLRGVKIASLADPTAEDLLKVAARLTGQTDVLMGKLELLDLWEVLGITAGFLGVGQKTGIASSQ